MSEIRTSAGTTLAVSASAPATYNLAGFQALTFTEVSEITDLGEFGRQYELSTHKPLADRRTIKRKGSYNDGSIAVPLARDAADAGQALMKAASLSDDSYSYRIVTQDGTTFYFSAQCMSFTNVVGGVDSITGHNAQLEIDNDILEASAVTHTLTYTAGANGSILGTSPQTVGHGASGTPVAAVAASGYEFVSWSDSSTENPRVDTDVVANITVTANFQLE